MNDDEISDYFYNCITAACLFGEETTFYSVDGSESEIIVYRDNQESFTVDYCNNLEQAMEIATKNNIIISNDSDSGSCYEFDFEDDFYTAISDYGCSIVDTNPARAIIKCFVSTYLGKRRGKKGQKNRHHRL
ncbi:hypothetical protein [Arsenophonus nasoniae]|uniref:Uncharacterized protein n=1 Tax=Arsenophonus nasoniae TaxID=638 RepID=D2TVH6_9GAMM|nr:hypothetical protein [Arsenophonus nasoniae]WGM09119.1 hypothetical protein QE258_27805 [Arsenophonus nasoniae]CBA71355.1 hypothetical protein ARN_00110 [Arsenophonus nasoniae]